MTHDLPFSPAAERNKSVVLDVLRQLLPAQALVLEIASGTGQHAAHCAGAEAGWRWQPSDADAQALAGIDLRCAGLPNVRPAMLLDVLAPAGPPTPAAFDAVCCANMLHISPWATCAGLMHGAARQLRSGGALVLYGPFLVDGETTAAGNLAFDADLRQRHPAWGLRRLAAVVNEAQQAGLDFERRFDVPANNLMLVFRRRAEAALADG